MELSNPLEFLSTIPSRNFDKLMRDETTQKAFDLLDEEFSEDVLEKF